MELYIVMGIMEWEGVMCVFPIFDRERAIAKAQQLAGDERLTGVVRGPCQDGQDIDTMPLVGEYHVERVVVKVPHHE